MLSNSSTSLRRAATSSSVSVGTPDCASRAVDRFGEERRWAAGGDLGMRLHQPSVRVPYEDGITCRAEKPRHCGVTEPDVEDRVEHSWHRPRGTRSHGEEEWTAAGTEAQPGGVLDVTDAAVDQGDHVCVEPPLTGVVGGADLGAEHEAGRDGQPGSGHSHEVGGLGANRLGTRSPQICRIEEHQPGADPGREVDAHRADNRVRTWSRRPSAERNNASVAVSAARARLSAT